MATNKTEQRYARASRNWGVIAVHPTELEAKYRELTAARQQYVGTTVGGGRTRTTSLAHLRQAVEGLLSNGYFGEEVGVIAASVIAEVTGETKQDTGAAKAAEMQAKCNAVIQAAIKELESLGC